MLLFPLMYHASLVPALRDKVCIRSSSDLLLHGIGICFACSVMYLVLLGWGLCHPFFLGNEESPLLKGCCLSAVLRFRILLLVFVQEEILTDLETCPFYLVNTHA